MFTICKTVLEKLELLRKQVFFVVACCLLISPAQGAVHSLGTIDQGWYNSSGSHNPGNTNTATGGIGAAEYRSWFKFTIPLECKDGVQSAQFSIRSVFPSRGTGAVPHNLTINAVAQANNSLVGVTTPSVAIYNDIGNGSVGSMVAAGNGDWSQSSVLAASALTDLAVAASVAPRTYVLGVKHEALIPTQYVMGYSQPANVTATLTINCAAISTLTLKKKVVNNFGGTATTTDFTPSIGGTATTWGTAVSLVPGNYTASESSLTGYSAGVWSGDCAADGTITLASGQNATCNITNSDIAAQLTLNKTVTNSHGGTAGASDFTPSIDGTTTTWGTPISLAAGSYTVSESILDGYEAGLWSGDCAADGTITLVLAQIANCSITNSDLGVDLQISKSTSDSNPNVGSTIGFTLSVSNAGPDTATDVLIEDILPAGLSYQPGSIFGGDARDDSSPAGTGLTWTINNLPVSSTVDLTFNATIVAP